MKQSFNDELISFYQYCPCSYVHIDNNSFKLCFSVWFNSEKTETYECYLEMDNETEKMIIQNHNFPNFLPLHIIEYKLLNKSIRSFILCISSCLNAYNFRKRQIEEANKTFKLENVFYNENYDLIQFDLIQSENNVYNIVLKYDDLRDFLPTHVNIKRRESSERVKEIENLFKNESIVNSINSIQKI